MNFDTAVVQTRYQSPLGSIIIAATAKGLAGLWFDDQRHLPRELVGPAVWPSDPDHLVLKEVISQLTEYFSGQRSSFDVPLDLAYGTAFQQSVWQALLKIPQGGTASYGEVSQRIGKPAAVRAVGAALPSRLLRIWAIRPLSPSQAPWASSAMRHVRVRPLASAEAR